MNAILMNMSANLLGMGNAATPFGIKAMEEMQKLNEHPARASDEMCTFLAINTSSLTILPSTIIALRVANGFCQPHGNRDYHYCYLLFRYSGLFLTVFSDDEGTGSDVFQDD